MDKVKNATKTEIAFFKKKKAEFFEDMNSLWQDIATLVESNRGLRKKNKSLNKKLNLK